MKFSIRWHNFGGESLSRLHSSRPLEASKMKRDQSSSHLDRQVFTNETATFIEAYCALVFTGALGVGSSLLWTNHPKGDASEGVTSDFIENIMLRFNASLHYTHHNICDFDGDFPGIPDLSWVCTPQFRDVSRKTEKFSMPSLPVLVWKQLGK